MSIFWYVSSEVVTIELEPEKQNYPQEDLERERITEKKTYGWIHVKALLLSYIWKTDRERQERT